MAKGLPQSVHATTLTMPRSTDMKDWRCQTRIDPYVLYDIAPQDIEQPHRIYRTVDLDREAVPVPIGENRFDCDSIFGSVTFDGGQPLFTPLPGHEHLFRSSLEAFTSAGTKQDQAQKRENEEFLAPTGDIVSNGQVPDQGTAVTITHDVNKNSVVDASPIEAAEELKTRIKRRAKKPVKPRTKGPRRSRPALSSHSVAVSPIPASPSATITEATTFSFYIGDIDALTHFWKTRLWECTLKPLRKILERWVSIRWPQRRRLPYDRPDKPAAERILGWPKDVRYKEPAHLKQPDCIELICSLLLDVRERDEETGKYRVNWIQKLKNVAEHELEYGPDAQFSNAKASSEYGRNYRALFKTKLWPSVMESAQNFEDHVAQYDLYEGRESSDPEAKRGKQITWSPIKRMPKGVRPRREPAKKRARRADTPAVEEIKASDSDDTDDEGCSLVQFEEGEANSAAFASQNSSFSSTLPDRSPSPTSTVADDDVEAQMEICPDSKVPAVVDEVMRPRPAFWPGESNCSLPPCSSFTSPNPFFPTSVQYNSGAVIGDSLSMQPFLRAQANNTFGFHSCVPSNSTSNMNSSFPPTGAINSGLIGTPAVGYIGEAEDMYPTMDAPCHTPFGYPSQAIESGNGYIMMQYNMQPMNYIHPPQQYNTQDPQRFCARNIPRLLQDRHFVGIPVEPTGPHTAEDPNSKPPMAMI